LGYNNLSFLQGRIVVAIKQSKENRMVGFFEDMNLGISKSDTSKACE